jgi:hypothetical protein
MNLQAEKLAIMKLTLETDNPKIIASIKQLFTQSPTQDFWVTLSPDHKQEIMDGLEDLDTGNTIDYDSFLAKRKR